MSKATDLQSKAALCRKWALEKSDWADNPNTQKRYAADPMALQRRRDEASEMFETAALLDSYAETLKNREAAA